MKANIFVLLSALFVLGACAESPDSGSSDSVAVDTSSVEESVNIPTSVTPTSVEVPPSITSTGTSESHSTSTEAPLSTDVMISLPDFEDSSTISTGTHYLKFIVPETVKVAIHEYTEVTGSDGEPTVAYGNEVSLDNPLAKGEYILTVSDTPNDQYFCFMNTYSFEEENINFIYHMTNVFSFNWLDAKNVTIDLTSYIANLAETGEEHYLGTFTAYKISDNISTPVTVTITSDSISYGGQTYALTKSTDNSFGIGMFGNGKVQDGFLYFYNGDLTTSSTDRYVGYMSSATFEIKTLWENVYNSTNYIMDVLINGQSELFYNYSGEFHSTLASANVIYQNTSLSDSSEIYIEDYQNKFVLNSNKYAKVRFYTVDKSMALNPKTDRSYFNYQQGGKEAGEYTLKGDPTGPKLILDGFKKCTYGELSGTYDTSITSTSLGYVYRITASFVGQDNKKFVLDIDNGTYEIDTSLNTDPFVTKTTFEDSAKRYLKAEFENGKVKLYDSTYYSVTFYEAEYTVRNSIISFSVDYDYEYNYETFSTRVSFSISVENGQYVLTLVNDVVIYDDMSAMDLTLYSRGLKLVYA